MTVYGMVVPRWITLALPDDVKQEVQLANLIGKTETQKRHALQYRLRLLRHECWDRYPTHRPTIPKAIRPSKIARVTGYRKNKKRWKK
jgi:hypothetical protein